MFVLIADLKACEIPQLNQILNRKVQNLKLSTHAAWNNNQVRLLKMLTARKPETNRAKFAGQHRLNILFLRGAFKKAQILR